MLSDSWAWQDRTTGSSSTLRFLLLQLIFILRERKKSNFINCTSEAKNGFAELKHLLITAPFLASPDFSLLITIYTDASYYGLGAVFTHFPPAGEKVISYISRSWNPAERHYSVMKKECFRAVFALKCLVPM